MMDFQEWLFARCIDCQSLTPEFEQSLLAQYEQDCQRAAPVAEVLVSNTDCPPKTHRLPVPVQMKLFDCRPEYQ